MIALPTDTGDKKAGNEPGSQSVGKTVQDAESEKSESEKSESSNGEAISALSALSAEGYASQMEKRLESVLKSMEGVGNVKVMITVSSSVEQIVEKEQPDSRSILTENSGDGTSRSQNEFSSEEATVYVNDSEGNQIPFLRKQMEPAIEGVLVVAEGGGNPAVSQNISRGIQALFKIEAHRIVVEKMKSQ